MYARKKECQKSLILEYVTVGKAASPRPQNSVLWPLLNDRTHTLREETYILSVARQNKYRHSGIAVYFKVSM